MGQRTEEQPKVKLFFALMSAREELFAQCEKRLSREFGPVDLRDAPYGFDGLTDYYAREFGTGLEKRIVSVQRLIDPGLLVEIKVRTNDVEIDLAREAKPGEEDPGRVINIDPGYLSVSKVVLATTKDQAHRVYVGRGVFEEVTLNYRRATKRFEPNPWTYTDYRMPGRIEFFGRLRELYRRQLKQE